MSEKIRNKFIMSLAAVNQRRSLDSIALYLLSTVGSFALSYFEPITLLPIFKTMLLASFESIKPWQNSPSSKSSLMIALILPKAWTVSRA